MTDILREAVMQKKQSSFFDPLADFLTGQYEKHRLRLFVSLGLLLLLIILVIVLANSGDSVSSEDLATGIAYIRSLEDTDTAEVENQIKEVKARERQEAIANGTVDIWTLFNDSVIMGDSRVVGFSYYGFLDENRVMAESGATILKISEYIEQAQLINPSTIFLSFGLNELEIGLWSTAEDYAASYDKQIAALQSALPDATIYVISTIPATELAYESKPALESISEWNETLKAHFAETGTHFIDVTATVEEHKDLYDVDGIHMQKDFYEYWAKTIMTEVAQQW